MGTGQEETGRTDLASRAPESSTGRRLTSRPNTFLSAFPLFALDFYNFLAVFLPSVEFLLRNGSRNKKYVTSPIKLTGRSPFFQHSRNFPQEFYFVGQVNSAIPNCPSNRQTFGNHNESKPKISWEKIIVFSGIVKFFLPLHKYEHQTGTTMIEKSWSALYSYVT